MRLLFYIVAAFLLTACGEDVPPAAHTEPEAGHSPDAEDGLIHLRPEQVAQAGLGYGGFRENGQQESLPVTARLVLHPEDRFLVSAYTEGVVSKLSVSRNARVSKGQVLASIRMPELLDWQQELLAVRSQLVFLRETWERYRSLQAADATAVKHLQAAEADLRTAEAREAALAAKLKAYRVDPSGVRPTALTSQLDLLAPVSGTVLAVHASEGAAVQPGTPLCEVADMQRLHADLAIFEKDLLHVRPGQSVLLSFPAAPDQAYAATIQSVDKTLDPANGILSAHARFDDIGWLSAAPFVAGAFMDGQLLTGGAPPHSLPVAAVVREGGDHFIFLRAKEDASGTYFRKVAVSPGQEKDGRIAVRLPDDVAVSGNIVLRGAYYVSAAGSDIELEE
ncbi:MAG: hypothetical protein RLY31_1597 [Bacteroidota bacterium]